MRRVVGPMTAPPMVRRLEALRLDLRFTSRAALDRVRTNALTRPRDETAQRRLASVGLTGWPRELLDRAVLRGRVRHDRARFPRYLRAAGTLRALRNSARELRRFAARMR